MEVETEIVSEMKDFLAGELEPHLDELYGKYLADDLDQSAPEL